MALFLVVVFLAGAVLAVGRPVGRRASRRGRAVLAIVAGALAWAYLVAAWRSEVLDGLKPLAPAPWWGTPAWFDLAVWNALDARWPIAAGGPDRFPMHGHEADVAWVVGGLLAVATVLVGYLVGHLIPTPSEEPEA